MLEQFILFIILGVVISQLIKLWFEGSLFEGLHGALFNFCYEEVETEDEDTTEIVKRKGILRGLLRGLTCSFCLTWEMALVLAWKFNLDPFRYFDFVYVTRIESVVGAAAILVFIAFPLYAILSRVREVSVQ